MRGPLKEMGNRLQQQKAVWKLPIGLWINSSAKQGGLGIASGEKTPPLLNASFSAFSEEQCVPFPAYID